MNGTLVLNRFEIGDRLGAGGFGTVYRAWDRRLEREVAVKVIETAAESGPRIQREAKAAARLNHTGIVTLYEFAHHEYGREGGRAYLVSELVDGQTVRELIDRDLVSDHEIAEIGIDICEALDHAHSREVVHRDIKPANLIVPNGRGGAKLMDFGVARLTDGDDLTNTGDVLGTLAYMSPEAAEGSPVTSAGDVYSLALTLFEAWTGENPRRKPTPSLTLRAIERDLPLLADLRPDLPPSMTEVVDACLDREPGFRPGIEDLGVALEEALPDLDRTVHGETRGTSGLIDFADGGLDLGRIACAAAVCGMVATGMIVSGNADAASVGVLGIISALLTLLRPKAGFLAGGVLLAAWLTVVASMPGAGFVVLLVSVPPALLICGSGSPLALAVLGPLLGTLGMAPFLPLLAALATDWRDRAVVAVTGLCFTALAESVTGRTLLFGKIEKASAGWENSVSDALTGLILPVAGSPSFLLSVAVWAGVALLVGAIVGWTRKRGGGHVPEPLTVAPVGSSRVPNA
ncbi:MAG: serine/threonine protein kinase [Solirubrobacterales bacterium]|nr:serine/threonine protein kinase [Solirubrobacterales bacterium]MCB8914276.1 serine/threonine protein kinase [Thermoleophilales bacterium]